MDVAKTPPVTPSKLPAVTMSSSSPLHPGGGVALDQTDLSVAMDEATPVVWFDVREDQEVILSPHIYQERARVNLAIDLVRLADEHKAVQTPKLKTSARGGRSFTACGYTAPAVMTAYILLGMNDIATQDEFASREITPGAIIQRANFCPFNLETFTEIINSVTARLWNQNGEDGLGLEVIIRQHSHLLTTTLNEGPNLITFIRADGWSTHHSCVIVMGDICFVVDSWGEECYTGEGPNLVLRELTARVCSTGRVLGLLQQLNNPYVPLEAISAEMTHIFGAPIISSALGQPLKVVSLDRGFFEHILQDALQHRCAAFKGGKKHKKSKKRRKSKKKRETTRQWHRRK